ncbi:chemotaxis protein CheA [Flavisphingomonas formosensis]|uniref:chemotaxis protein CheA n=1 Tax=Flavisphingomonas formosensis TaxID=861534 RepID=UPI0012F7343B|nr:chemotaxis protein CheW [Sphingomonas formosensis]
MDEILTEFIAETRETLETVAGELVAWEAVPQDRTRLDGIFRFVHTVKGSCGFLDLPRLERLSHACEDALADVRADRRVPDAMLVDAVLAIIDRIVELIDALEAQGVCPSGDDRDLIEALAERRPEPPTALLRCPSEPEPDLCNEGEPPLPTAPASTPRAPSRSIRLQIDLLDRMMAGISDMVLARNELARRLREISSDPGVDAAFERLSTSVAEMRDTITRTRMQRIEALFSGLPRLLRDVSAELGKTVMLEVDGADVELDREMIEVIRDPLTHIIRNAIDHGIEPPGARLELGKPAIGRLSVAARQAGNQIVIEVADDGRGIDSERLVQRAIAAGILSADAARGLSAAARLALIFEPGLSTAQEVTAISGRGVGMDVVKSNIERIGGVVEIDSRPGSGLKLTLRVPLTLTIIPALTIEAGGLTFALPRAAIDEIVRVAGESVRLESLGGALIANIRGRRMPVACLARIIDAEDAPEQSTMLVVLKPAGGEAYALAVAAVHDHEELVIKPAAPVVMAAGIYAGAALPDNGRPILLLDPAGLAVAGGVSWSETARIEPEVPVAAIEAVPTLLFRDSDGVERGIRLSLVERIEDIPAQSVKMSAGRLRVVRDGRLLPLISGEGLDGREIIRILRISDGEIALAYAIDTVRDIVDLTTSLTPAARPGPVAGVALVDGQPVEMLDPHWLFAEGGAIPLAAEPERPICLLTGDDGSWTREILRPLVESNGYRVLFAREPSPSDVALVIACDAPEPAGTRSPVVRLRWQRETAGAPAGSIYRYDRPALLDALKAGLAQGGHR